LNDTNTPEVPGLPRTFGGTLIFIVFVLAMLLVGSAIVGIGFGWGLLFIGAL